MTKEFSIFSTNNAGTTFIGFAAIKKTETVFQSSIILFERLETNHGIRLIQSVSIANVYPLINTYIDVLRLIFQQAVPNYQNANLNYHATDNADYSDIEIFPITHG